MTHPYTFWIGFHLLIGCLLFLDLGVLHRRMHPVRMKEALLLSAFWIALALLFNLFVYFTLGPEAGLQFFTGYLIEKSLSVDNLFVFLMIFTYFKVPNPLQHKVLYWGIWGAVIFRIILILAGVALVKEFHWITYILGALIMCTGLKFAVQKEKKAHFERNLLVRCVQRFLPLSHKPDPTHFFVYEKQRWKMTSLFLVHLMIESSDVVFALDSIPAIFAVTDNAFIIYTSNIFAVLGLRSLYFVLSGTFDKLRFFKYGLGAILIFIGLKMLLAKVFPIPLSLSLGVVVLILAATILISLRKSRQ